MKCPECGADMNRVEGNLDIEDHWYCEDCGYVVSDEDGLQTTT
jgi:transposase-like protein